MTTEKQSASASRFPKTPSFSVTKETVCVVEICFNIKEVRSRSARKRTLFILIYIVLSQETDDSDEVADSSEIKEDVPYHVCELVLTCKEDKTYRVAKASCDNKPEARTRCSVEESRCAEDDEPSGQDIYCPRDDLACLRLRIHQGLKEYSCKSETPLCDAHSDSEAASDKREPDRCICSCDTYEHHAVVELARYVLVRCTALCRMVPCGCKEHQK